MCILARIKACARACALSQHANLVAYKCDHTKIDKCGFPEKTQRATLLIYDLALSRWPSSKNQHKHGKVAATDRRRMASPFSLYTGPYSTTSPARSFPLVAFGKTQKKNIASFDYSPRGRGDARDTGRRRGRLSFARGRLEGG